MKRNNHLLFQRSVLSSLVNQQPNSRPHSTIHHNKRSSMSRSIAICTSLSNPASQLQETQNIPPLSPPSSNYNPRTTTNPLIPLIQNQHIHPVILPSHQKQDELFSKLKQSKHNQQIFKATIKNKFLAANKRPPQTSSQNHRSHLPSYRISTINSSSAKTSQSFINQKQQINQWLRKTKATKQSSISTSKTNICLKNTDKFNIDFVEYLKKKSYRRIEKEKINRIISRKENIVEMFQEHLLKNSGLGLKSKQNMRKCFEFLNNQRKKKE